MSAPARAARLTAQVWGTLAAAAVAGAQPPGPPPPPFPPPTLSLGGLVAAGAPAVTPNDNRRPAGRLADGVLTVALEARPGVWRPEGPDGPALPVFAFAEVGRAPSTPGPLVRVPVGTRVRATVRNAAAVPITLYGFGRDAGATDGGAVIAPGATRAFAFRADAPGARLYVARAGAHPPGPPVARFHDDAQLHGAIVVDAAGAAARRARDRVFVISEWATWDPATVSGLGPNATLALNGLSWPFTERLTMAQTDSARWRVLNASLLEHPMHLHGAYFRVDARGDVARDTVYAPAERRTVVTEVLQPGQTMAMTWTPVHPGNWVFHCHFASHISPRAAFEADRRMPPAATLAADRGARARGHAHAAGPPGPDGTPRHMEGLVLGVTVTPAGPVPAPPRRSERPLRLVARSRANVYGEYVGYAYVLGGSAAERAADSLPVPGPTLELVRGEPVAVTLVNRMHESMAVHWHGIELESFPDGVPGWSGAGRTTMPMIAPGDSLTVRFTPPRAGTFMYHAHGNEMQQISSGLHGTIVVREPGERADPETDRVLVVADGGPTLNFFGPPPPITVAGMAAGELPPLPAGRPVRLRLVNIRTEYSTRLTVLADSTPLAWRVVAKDGMPVPGGRVRLATAELMFAPGEIYDVELAAPAGRALALRVESTGLAPGAPSDARQFAIRTY